MKHQWKSMKNQWKINENQWKINENWSKNEPTHIFHDRFFESIEPSPKIDPKWALSDPKATKSNQIGTKIWFWSVSFITLVINETLQNWFFDKIYLVCPEISRLPRNILLCWKQKESLSGSLAAFFLTPPGGLQRCGGTCTPSTHTQETQ